MAQRKSVPDNLSTDSIVTEMKAFEGPLILGSPVLQCGKYPEAPGVCNDYTQFYKYNGANDVEASPATSWVRQKDGSDSGPPDFPIIRPEAEQTMLTWQ